MTRFFLHLAYDGTDFHGWQIQPDSDTVQERIDKALSTLLRQQIATTGCGRTDTGVHASQFFAHFDTDTPPDSTEQLRYQLNAILPYSIRIYEVIKVSDEAHARYDAHSRTYGYYLHRNPSPFRNNYTTHFAREVDVDEMNCAADLCIAHSDFACFSKTGGQQNSTTCRILECCWEERQDELRFTVTANRFLRGMVRAMVGTMLDVGMKKISMDEFQEILNDGDRTKAGESAPAKGLFLEQVTYPYLFLPRNNPFVQ